MNWNEARGFGFVRPEDGGEDVFAHVSSFRDRARKPETGDAVSFAAGKDAQGRPRAERVVYAGTPDVSGGVHAAPLGLAAGTLLVLAGAATAGKLQAMVSVWYVVASLFAFLIYARDKWAARTGRWRTSEKALHLWSLAGGWPGALAAQALLRHKSRKQSFRIVFWATVVLNCVVLAWLLSARGGQFLRTVLGDSAGMGIWNALSLVLERII